MKVAYQEGHISALEAETIGRFLRGELHGCAEEASVGEWKRRLAALEDAARAKSLPASQQTLDVLTQRETGRGA